MDIGKIIEIGEVTVRRPEDAPAKPQKPPREKPAPAPAEPAVRTRAQRGAIASTVTRSK